jgi:hypothetical protein
VTDKQFPYRVQMDGYAVSWPDSNFPLKDVTRVEVIEEGDGRTYTCYGADNVELAFQDEGKTLKIFLKRDPSKYNPKRGWSKL